MTKHNIKIPRHWLGAAVLLLALASSSCRTRQVKGASAQDGGPAQPGLFTLSQEQLSHIKIAQAKRADWALTVRTTGTVDWDADHTSPAITQVSGPIARIVANTGSQVAAGDPLLYVPSPDVTGALSAYRKALNRLDLAKRALVRNRDLLEHQAIARKDFESVEADYNDAATEVESDRETLRILGIGKVQLDEAEQQGAYMSPELVVRAPISGVVVQKLVSPGQLIQAGNTTCFLISDVSTVWVQGHIYEQDLASIRVGDKVEETTPSSSQVFHGVISYIGVMVDPATRTTPVRIVTQNPGGALKKDMLVDATIHTTARRNVLSVPVSAVLHDPDNQPFVYQEVEPGRFARRAVVLGAPLDDQVEILSGCREGDRVVSEGAVFLEYAGNSQ
jgi:cobalt-zinc-cadmium efflux system membrane fusion protein